MKSKVIISRIVHFVQLNDQLGVQLKQLQDLLLADRLHNEKVWSSWSSEEGLEELTSEKPQPHHDGLAQGGEETPTGDQVKAKEGDAPHLVETCTEEVWQDSGQESGFRLWRKCFNEKRKCGREAKSNSRKLGAFDALQDAERSEPVGHGECPEGGTAAQSQPCESKVRQGGKAHPGLAKGCGRPKASSRSGAGQGRAQQCRQREEAHPGVEVEGRGATTKSSRPRKPCSQQLKCKVKASFCSSPQSPTTQEETKVPQGGALGQSVGLEQAGGTEVVKVFVGKPIAVEVVEGVPEPTTPVHEKSTQWFTLSSPQQQESPTGVVAPAVPELTPPPVSEAFPSHVGYDVPGNDFNFHCR